MSLYGDVLSAFASARVRYVAVIVFASREHLIAMKRASGRPQDLEDVRALERDE